jgi:O-antigen ligase
MKKLSQLFEKSSLFLMAAVLVIVPLFPKFPLISVPGTYVAIRFEDLLLLALGIVVLVKIIANFRDFLNDEIVQAFLIFFVVGFVSLLAGTYLTRTDTLLVGTFNWLRRVEYAVPFFAAILLLKKEKISEHISYFIKVLMLVTVVVFIYGYGQIHFRFPAIITQNGDYSRGMALFWIPGSQLNSTFAGQYDLSAFMVMILPIFITLMVLLKDKLSKLLLFIVSATGLWLLIQSAERVGQVAYLVSVGLALLLVKRARAAVLILVISLIFIASSAGVIKRFESLFNVHAQSITTIAPVPILTPVPTPVVEDRSVSIRLNEEWPEAIRAFEKNPLIGTGYSSIGLATDNDYLRMLGEIGILGVLAFGLIFFRIGKVLAKGIGEPFVSSIWGTLAGTFSIALFIDIFEASKFATIFWFLLGCAVFLVRSGKYDKKY